MVWRQQPFRRQKKHLIFGLCGHFTFYDRSLEGKGNSWLWAIVPINNIEAHAARWMTLERIQQGLYQPHQMTLLLAFACHTSGRDWNTPSRTAGGGKNGPCKVTKLSFFQVRQME